MTPCEALSLALLGRADGEAEPEPDDESLEDLVERFGGTRGLAAAMVGNRAAWSRRAQLKGAGNASYAPNLRSEMRTVERWRKGETRPPEYRLAAVRERLADESEAKGRRLGARRRAQLVREGARVRLAGTIQISPPKSERRVIPSRGLNAPGYPVAFAEVLARLAAGDCDGAGELLMAEISDAFEADGGPGFTVVDVESLEIRPMAGWD